MGAAAFDPGRLLFVPGRKVYSIPSPRVFTPMEIAEAVKIINRMMDHRYGEQFDKFLATACVQGTGFVRLSYEHNRIEVGPRTAGQILHNAMIAS